MTPEEFAKFEKAYRDMLKRRGAASTDKEKLEGPQRGNRTLPNQGVKRVDPGAQGTAQCTIEATDADFRSMIDGGMQAAMQLFFSGKLKVTGDANLATKLSKLLQMAS